MSISKTVSTKSDLNNCNISDISDLGTAQIRIGGPSCSATLNLEDGAVVSSGQWKARLIVSYNLPYYNGKIEGEWFAYALFAGREFFRYQSIPYEYTNDTIPETIDEEFEIFIPITIKASATIHCGFGYNLYYWDEDAEEWIFDDSYNCEDKETAEDITVPYNRPVLDFLEGNPNMFLFLKLLIHMLRLK